MRIRSTVAVLLLAFHGVCAHAADDAASAEGIRSALLNAQAALSQGSSEEGRLKALRTAYVSRGFAPLWSRNGTPTPQASALQQILRTADTFGLLPQHYETDLTGDPPGSRPPAQFDMALSAAAARLLMDLHFGRVDPRAAGFDLENARPPLELGALLEQLATTDSAGQVIASIEPQFYHYGLLKLALARYRLLAAGTIPATRSELLTVPFARRVRQIELTLERWRWLPAFSSPPIIVNIPQFRLFAFQSTQDRKAAIIQMDVIVGRMYPALRTPVFAADMKYVVFRPFWDVPYSITKREMLPQIRADPDYLRKEHLEIVRGPGDSAEVVPPGRESLDALASGALRLRQQPGQDNSLGLIKFMLPNTYNVYLHSTPARQLFKQSRRAFSHGCIRVSDPVALAAHVLRNTPGAWTPATITAAMNGGSTLRVNLPQPIRVMVLYGTALATEDGAVEFFDDIYGHDRKLEQLLGLAPVAGK
jgi:murein L,D-transpeptidase YcbB/YkuD